MHSLRTFLNQHRCQKGQAFTHTSIGNPKISVCIPEELTGTFYEIYQRAMLQDGTLHLTERPTDPSPMCVDLDFRFSAGEDGRVQRVYTQDTVRRIVAKYSALLTEYLVAGPQDLKAFVMEKPEASEYRGKIKDGLHIVWPHLVVSHTLQHLIRQKFLEAAEGVLGGLGLVNPYEDVVDKSIIDKTNWQMYGSSKVDKPAYRVTQIYTYSAEDTLESEPSPTPGEELSFVRLFSMRHRGPETPLRPDKAAEVEEYATHICPSLDARRKSKLQTDVFGKTVNRAQVRTSEDDVQLARSLVMECLDRARRPRARRARHPTGDLAWPAVSSGPPPTSQRREGGGSRTPPCRTSSTDRRAHRGMARNVVGAATSSASPATRPTTPSGSCLGSHGA